MRSRILWSCALLGLLGAACGGGSTDLAAFCAAGAEMDTASSAEEFQEGFARLADEAPDEIADDVRAVADALEGAGDEAALGAAFADPELSDALQRISEFGEENCETED